MAYSKSSPASDALLIRSVFIGASVTTSSIHRRQIKKYNNNNNK